MNADFNSSNPALDQSQCKPTTGQGFSVIDVFNFFPALDIQATYIHMIMPIMTFLWTPNNTADSTTGMFASDFSCLELKYDNKLTIPAGVSGASRLESWSKPLVALGVLISALL
jgi:hypothetical protein